MDDDSTMIIILLSVFVCCVCISISIGGGIAAPTTTAARTTTTKPVQTTTTKPVLTSAPASEITINGKENETISFGCPVNSGSISYGKDNNYITYNIPAKSTNLVVNNTTMGGDPIPGTVKEFTAKFICSEAREATTNPCWNCYLISNKTRQDSWNDAGSGGGLCGYSQNDASNTCNAWISNCGNMGGCTAYKVGQKPS